MPAPFASGTSPSGSGSRAGSGARVGAAVTVTVHFAFFLLKLRTVIVALPAARPVTLPLPSTAATAGLLLI